MPVDVPQFGLGLVGTGPFGHHLLDRLSFREDLKVVAACAADRQRLDAIAACDVHPQPQEVVSNPRAQIVYFADTPTAELVESAIRRHCAVVLATTAGLTASDLCHLAEVASECQSLAVVEQPRRWDDDFLCAKAVFDLGHLGRIERIRLAIHETGLPGERFAAGVLRELGCHWLDQLLVFAAGACKSAMLRKFYHAGGATEAGFLATLEFEDGTSAVLEVQTASLLSLRTGWLLEGSHGAYRAGRRYSKAADGEIIDEPVTVPETSRDPFLDHLVKATAGDPSACGALVPLSHAARTVSLFEQLEAASEPTA